MPRSIKKGPYVDFKLFKKVQALEAKGIKQPIKTWSRRSVILPEFLEHRFDVHNGKIFVPVYVTLGMIGCKLGEFALTRVFRGHKGPKKVVKK